MKMTTPDINEVRVGLRHCMYPPRCGDCPYLKRIDSPHCGMYAEALALLDELEAARATLAEEDKYVKELKEAVGMKNSDKELVESIKLDNNAVLQRVINAGGIPYSIILVDGVEMYSAPTSDEKGLIAYYKEAVGP